MKTAIYIEDGLCQLVITPETEFEKNALTTFQDKPLEANLYAGSFYRCAGGWARQNHGPDKEDRSLILVAKT